MFSRALWQTLTRTQGRQRALWSPMKGHPMRNSGKAIAFALALLLSAPGLSACDSKQEKRKYRPQPVWSRDTSKPKPKPKSPKPVISCSPGDKRWVCPQ